MRYRDGKKKFFIYGNNVCFFINILLKRNLKVLLNMFSFIKLKYKKNMFLDNK